MKLKEWCEQAGVKYITGYRWFKAGILPVKAYQTKSGTIIVDDIQESIEQNDNAISLFLKKTVEFSKNNGSVEDFAAYVISNFSLKLNNSEEGPKYSRQKPKSEDVQKHFQQFIVKSEKPKPNSFVMEPQEFEGIATSNITIARADVEALVKEFSQAVETPAPPPGYVSTFNPVSVVPISDGLIGSTSTEGTITRSVDLNTTPQPINYTGSNNLAFSCSSTSLPSSSISNIMAVDGNFFNELAVSDIDTQTSLPLSNNSAGVFLNNTVVTYDSLKEIAEPINQITNEVKSPRSRRGRKPRKK